MAGAGRNLTHPLFFPPCDLLFFILSCLLFFLLCILSIFGHFGLNVFILNNSPCFALPITIIALIALYTHFPIYLRREEDSRGLDR